MNKIIIRLPGGGRINKNQKDQEISWWDYRNFYIQPGLYLDIKKILENNKDSIFFFVSGGVGAFLYTDLCYALKTSKKITSQIGCDVVSLMHRILISNLAESGVNVCPHEKNLDELNNIRKLDYSCYFIKPDTSILSTDSLATHVVPLVNANMIVYLKEGAPVYHVGFDKPTKMIKWHIDDIRSRAMCAQGNYIIDEEALNLIEQNNIKTLITNPDIFSNFIFNDDMFGLGSIDSFTEILK